MAYKITEIESLATHLKTALAASTAGNFRGAIGGLAGAFTNLFQFAGAGMLAYSALETARSKELSWYEKIFPVTAFGLGAGVALVTGVVLSLGLSLAVPPLMFLGSAATFIRNMGIHFSEWRERRRIKKIFSDQNKLKETISKMSLPSKLQNRLFELLLYRKKSLVRQERKDLKDKIKALKNQVDKAQKLLKSHKRLPATLFELEPDVIREMGNTLGLDQNVINQLAEASQATRELVPSQELLKQWDTDSLRTREMRDVMVRVLNHSLNTHQGEQEKAQKILSLLPKDSKRSLDETLDILNLPESELNRYNNLTDEQEKVRLRDAYRLPPALKSDLIGYLNKTSQKMTPEEEQKAGKFIVQLADHYAKRDPKLGHSLLHHMVFEKPDMPFENINQWMKDIAQKPLESQFQSEYGEIMNLFEKRQRLHFLSSAANDRLKVIGLSGISMLTSGLACFVPLGLMATPAAAAAPAVYAGLSAAAAAPAAGASLIGTKLGLRSWQWARKVGIIRTATEGVIAPSVEDEAESEKIQQPKEGIKKGNWLTRWLKSLFSPKPTEVPSAVTLEQENKSVLGKEPEKPPEPHSEVKIGKKPSSKPLVSDEVLEVASTQTHLYKKQAAVFGDSEKLAKDDKRKMTPEELAKQINKIQRKPTPKKPNRKE